MAYIDIKYTHWERVEIPDDVIVPEFSNTSEVYNFIEQYDLESYILEETIFEMSLKENGNESTVEVYDDEGDLVFNN